MSISSKWTTLLRYITSQDYRDYRFVRKLHLFDSDYYLALLSGSFRSTTRVDHGDDLLWSYFQNSREERKKIVVSKDNWQQLNDPHPLFDTWFYLSRYGKQVGNRNPFAHYLTDGWKQGFAPSPFFNADFYSTHSIWDRTMGDPLSHFIHNGLKAKQSPSVLFDLEWYHHQTPDSDFAAQNAFKHYKLFGISEGKSPHQLFKPNYYLSQDGVPRIAEEDPYLHYLLVGEQRGYKPIKYFHPSYYRDRYMEDGEQKTAFEHHLSEGIALQHEPNAAIQKLTKKPIISIIVPVYNPDQKYLEFCIRSVVYQSYPNWQLCLVDDCSSIESPRGLIRKWTEFDDRIISKFRDQNGGISAATQTGFEISSGEYVGFLDNDDKLSKDCLFHVVRTISETDEQIIYSDEDLVGGQGERLAVFRKPGFNRALLYAHNYITHFCVVSRELFQRVGGMRSECDGAQDYDLMLRLAEEADTMAHIPRILYHWRALATSTSIAHEQKPYAHDAGRRALQHSIDRSRLAGRVEGRDLNYHYRIELNLAQEPSVAVLYHAGAGMRSLERLKDKTDYRNCKFFSSERTDQKFAKANNAEKTSVFKQLIDESESEYVALLGNGFDRITRNWLSELISKFGLDAEIGITCGRVNYNGADGPSYTIAEVDNNSVSYYAAFMDAASRHANGLQNLQFINGCNWHICVLKRSLYNQLDGFDINSFPQHLTMLDFCYRATARGNKILYTPDAMVDCNLSNQRPEDDKQISMTEKELFQKRHCDQLQQIERWYNIQHMADRGKSRKEFYRWLVGKSG